MTTSPLDNESFSSVKDAALHRAALAEEVLKREKSSGIVYSASVVVMLLLFGSFIGWHLIPFLYCLYLPVRDIYRASKKRDLALNEYFEKKGE